MSFKIDILANKINNSICPFCFGAGKLKAMQSMATYDGSSVRGKDRQIECKYCNGTGIREV